MPGRRRRWVQSIQSPNSVQSMGQFSSINVGVVPSLKRISQTANCSLEWVPCWFFLHFAAILPPTNRRSPLAQGYVIGRLEPLLCFVCPKMPILGLIHSHVWISWTLMPFQLHISKKLSKLSTTSALRQVFWLRGSTRLSSLCSPPEGLMMFLFVIIFRFHLDYITMSTQMIHLFYVKGQWFPLIKLPFSMSTPQKNILFFHWFV